jgi:hypothetical protein
MSYLDHTKQPTTDQKAALAGTTGTPGASNPYVLDNDPRLDGLAGIINIVAAATIFGSGRDGALTFDGSAVTGFSLSGSTYTRTALSDLHATTVNISSNYHINMAGFRFRAFEVVAGSNCSINNDAPLSSSTTTASAGAPPAAVATSTTNSIFYGGGAGATGSAAASGNGAAPTTVGVSAAVRYGGLGGAGGRSNLSGTIRTGGAGGAATNNGTTAYHYYGDPWEILLGSFPYSRNGTTIIQVMGGTGGGTGGRSFTGGTTVVCGGPGGGGVLGVAIKTLSCGTNFTISCDGAAQTTLNSNTGSTYGFGGNGGGGGGALACIVGELNGSNIPTFTADGGRGGDGVASGAGYWGEGGNGGNGGCVTVYIGANNVGGTPSTTADGGTKGDNADPNGLNPTWTNANGTAGTASYEEGGA